MYLHGDDDWLVKPWHSNALFEKTRSKKKLVLVRTGSHAEYMLRHFSKKIIPLIKSWFSKTLKADAQKLSFRV